MTNDNKYIPTVISVPRKEPIYEKDFHEPPKSSLATKPTRSTYQANYEKPATSMKHYTPLCKAAALQSLMKRDKYFAAKFDKHKVSLSALDKRRNEIDAILLKR